jgi:hypothetical protein
MLATMTPMIHHGKTENKTGCKFYIAKMLKMGLSLMLVKRDLSFEIMLY